METNFSGITNNIFVKGAIIAVLTMLMLIPISLVTALIDERQDNEVQVEGEISQKWGGSQTVTGPVLVLPYEKEIVTYIAGKEIKKSEMCEAYFLPDELTVDGEMLTEERSRSLHKVLVYQSQMKISGQFALPNYMALGISEGEVRWKDAYMIVGISNMQGIKNKISINVNGNAHPMEAGVKPNKMMTAGLLARMPMDPTRMPDKFKFDLDLALNGTPDLCISPVGKETHVRLKSPWKTVSFVGEFLPSDRSVTDAGFDAQWDVFDYNRNYTQMWTSNDKPATENPVVMDDATAAIGSEYTVLGVDLRYPVDQYQMAMRSAKYAILFIALTFVAFFLIELLSSKPIHPVQYLLVSFALVLFYSLLLAFSEHVGFRWAYLISATAIVALITAYSSTIMKSWKQTAIVAILLVSLYTYLFVVLQMEDQSLLFGSIGLFVALAIIMFVSRKINWYKSAGNQNRSQQTPPEYIDNRDNGNDYMK